MAHVNIYLDDELLQKVRTAAEVEHTSLSSFIRSRLEESLAKKAEWPDGYFENVVGSLSDEELERPPQPDFEADARRDTL